jgi:hypothetical protein
MSARSRLHDPLAEVPFWRTRGFLLGAITLAVFAVAGLTIWLIRENRRQQMEWRLEDDPRLAGIKKSLAAQIDSGKPSQPRAPVPVALWLGRVKEFTVSVPTSGAPAVSLLKLEEANLLAGARAKNDGSDTVTISGKQYTFGGPQPRTGESWLVSVWRDTDGNNVIHSATRAEKR